MTRDGALTRAEGDNLAMLEWALPEGADPNDLEAAKACNPASWLRPEGLAEQRDAVRELAWQRYHLNVWTGGEAPWILPDQWDANAGEPELEGEGFKVIGIDAAVSSDTAALALVRRDPDDIYHLSLPGIGHGASRVFMTRPGLRRSVSWSDTRAGPSRTRAARG